MILQRAEISKAIKDCRGGRNRLRRKAMVIAGTIVGVYLLLLAGLTLSQRHLMYFPSRYPMPVLEGYAAQQQFEAWKNAAGQSIGWKRLSPKREGAAQILILHGNAGQALDRTPYADAVQAIGAFDVYILEYPGYGARPGKPAQKPIFATASEGLSLLNTNRPIYLIGESLGTGVAAYLAGNSKIPMAGILLIAPYNKMSAVAQHHMRLFPVRWLIWDKYPSDKYLKNYSGPVGILVGGRDTVIPSRFGRKLYDSYGGPKRLWEEPDAGHNDLHQQPLEWWKGAMEFLQKTNTSPSTTPGATPSP